MLLSIGYIFLLQLILFLVLYWTSHFSMQLIYAALRKLRCSDHLSKMLLSLFFLPGTFIHEFSHFITALVSGHHIISFSIMPVVDEKGVRMGSVTYYHKSPIHTILVGIAPMFGGYLSSYFLYFFTRNVESLTVLILVWYIQLTIMSSMFSSKKDMEEAAWLLPISLLLITVFYILGFELIPMLVSRYEYVLKPFLYTNLFLQLISLGIHLMIIVLYRVVYGRN